MSSRSVVLVVLLSVAGVAGFVSWRATGLAAAPENVAEGQARAVAVEVAPVTSGVIREVRVLSGTLRASTRFDCAAKISGLIEQMKVDLGDEVERGQPVAVIDDDEFVQALLQAQAELAVRQAEVARAEAELGRVQREFDRLSSLAKRGVVTDTELDEISATLASQKASVALADAQAPLARAVVGGLIASMLVTLVLIPAVYCLMHPERSAEPAPAQAPMPA